MIDDALIASWSRSKRAEGRSEATIEAYENDTRRLAEHLASRGHELSTARRGDLEACLAEGREAGLAPATLARRFRSWKQFYRWAEEEEEVAANPMAKMKPPKVVAPPVPIITAETLAKLLAECARPKKRIGRPAPPNPNRATFENKRDTALVMMLSTTGVRAGEIMGLAVDDVDLNSATFTVMGKGGRARVVALMPKPAEALDRYMRVRRHHAAKALPALWLGERGQLTGSGLRQLLDRRCDDAGIEHINPHRFRHTFAHEAKSRGMSDGDLMSIAGWQSPQMLHRYGASAAADRARDAHRRLFGGQL